MSFFLLLNTTEDILKNVGNRTVEKINKSQINKMSFFTNEFYITNYSKKVINYYLLITSSTL